MAVAAAFPERAFASDRAERVESVLVRACGRISERHRHSTTNSVPTHSVPSRERIVFCLAARRLRSLLLSLPLRWAQVLLRLLAQRARALRIT